MTDLDKELLRCRFEYRRAYKNWYRLRNSVDVQARVDAQEKLNAAERAFLEIGRRGEREE